MNIHEYQAKELFKKFGIQTPNGRVASTPGEAYDIAEGLKADKIVIKAQIHAGGRGKGTFKGGLKGGVHICSNAADVEELSGRMLKDTLVTHQTGAAGRVVRKVLIAEAVMIEKEFYFAILIDRASACPIVVASTEGGVEIEEVAEKTPERVFKKILSPFLGLQPYIARELARQLGFSGKQLAQAAQLFVAVYKLFIECDCSLIEINPLVLTKSGVIQAVDAKFGFDDNALYRQPEILAMRDEDEEDPREVAASRHGLNYIGLTGNIGCMVNGAGLAMATMDTIKHYSGNPANFLDVGGGANEDQVREAFSILLADKKVRAILVNIFGGIMKCDIIAQGIINAAKNLEMRVPVVVRLEGTNVELGRKMLEDSGLNLISANSLADAAERVVQAAKPNRES